MYFSDRERGPRARATEEITEASWGALVAIVRSRLGDGSFAQKFPVECPDGKGIYASDSESFGLALRGHIPELKWPLDPDNLPDTLAGLDLLEFGHRYIAKPIQTPNGFHSFFDHWHLAFKKDLGEEEFRDEVNRVLSRSGLAFTLEDDGRVTRLAGPGLDETLRASIFDTGDDELDSLLESARSKFLSPDPKTRREALEKLWDAWERLKTIERQLDKKASIGRLLDEAAKEPSFRARLESEAKELTEIGNKFRIRHSEVTQIQLKSGRHVDYLFHRMFAMIHLLLRSTGRLT